MESIREENVFPVIEKLRDTIVGKCKKCDNGFIREGSDKPSLKNLIYPESKQCECYKRYQKYSSFVVSGIQREFWDIKDKPLDIDDISKKKITTYIDKLDAVYERGIGLLFIGAEDGLRNPNSGFGKTYSAMKVLLNVLDKDWTVHNMTMHGYFNLIYRSKQEISLLPLIDEIENVDFLVIDEVGKINRTDYVVAKFEDMIRDRASKLLKTIAITNMNKRELSDTLGKSVMDIMKNTMSEIQIKRTSSFRKERFLNLKKEISEEL